MKKNSFKIVLFFILFISILACNQNNQTKIADVIPDTDLIEDISVPDNLYPSDTIIITTHTDFTKTHYPKRIDSFRKNPLVENDIVFLGNSITEQGNNWASKVNNSKAKNRGISGDTTEGVLARLGELIYYKPKQVFILIGINDLFRDDMTSEKVFKNILKIVNQIHDGSPRTKIFVQTILPTSTINLKEKIQATNFLLTNAEATAPYKIISLHTHFATKDDLMNMEFSADGVHLNEKGYEVWVKTIINLI